MNQPIQLTIRNSLVRKLIVPVALFTAFAFSTIVQGVVPAPDGGYPGQNTAEGDDALFSLTTGLNNTAVGFDALFSNTSANNNTATGSNALADNSTGPDNTACGAEALTANTTGGSNAAFGYQALRTNTTSGGHTAIGTQALANNTDGVENTATGYTALLNNTTGGLNVANGFEALANNTTGFSNTAVGADALQVNVTSGNNTAVGHFALRNSTGAGNIALGESAGVNLTTGSNNIDIGNTGVAGESGRIRIGTAGTHSQTFVAGVRGATVSGGIAVFVNANGKLGTNTSSRRFKEQIKPMAEASAAILSLNPVTFRYKSDLDPDGIPQFGLVAEEVEKIHPDLVVRDEKGDVYSVRYEAVNAMLLNEFLKEHRKVEQHEATIADLRKEIAAVNARIEEHEAQIQKVGARLEASRSAPQLADNE
jgi:Chaperone of endosialidase